MGRTVANSSTGVHTHTYIHTHIHSYIHTDPDYRATNKKAEERQKYNIQPPHIITHDRQLNLCNNVFSIKIQIIYCNNTRRFVYPSDFQTKYYPFQRACSLGGGKKQNGNWLWYGKEKYTVYIILRVPLQ